MHKFKFLIIIKDLGNSSTSTLNIRPVAYITSEANIFGVVGGGWGTKRWYDGKVDEVRLGENRMRVSVTSVQETISAGSCSKKPFYEMVAKHYFEKDFTTLNLTYSTLNGTAISCPSKYKCMPLTLSFNYPTCTRDDYNDLVER